MKRRDFLKSSLAAAGYVIVPKFPGFDVPKAQKIYISEHCKNTIEELHTAYYRGSTLMLDNLGLATS